MTENDQTAPTWREGGNIAIAGSKYSIGKSLFDFLQEGSTDAHQEGMNFQALMQTQKHCLYLIDNKILDAVFTQREAEIELDLRKFSISSPAFETLARGLWAMLPIALGIKISDIIYRQGLKVIEKHGRAFARYDFNAKYFENVHTEEFNRKASMCIELLKNKSLWKNERMKDNSAHEIPGLLEIARQVRHQIGTRELPNTCTFSGAALVNSIEFEKSFGAPKPVVEENVSIKKIGEVKGFHGEFRQMHFVYGRHRNVIDIGYDEALFKEQIMSYATTAKIMVEAEWVERRQNGVMKSAKLINLKVVQENLFNS